MSSFKKLSKSDVTVVPYHANKQWGLNYCPYPTSSDYLTIYTGTNVTGAFSLNNDPVTENEYERLVYSQINQLFYQTYSASLDTSSLMFSLDNYASASQQRPTSSYFIYNDNDILIQNYPTGAMEGIRVLSVNQNIYGNKVLPNYFILSSSAYYVIDDGYGNLYDTKSTKTHIGNIYYAQGLAIITNQDYQYMFPQPPIAKNDTGSFLTSDVPKVISASLNDYARSGTLNTSTIAFSGSFSGPGYSFATSSNGTIVLTTSIPGTYTVYYTIGADVSCSLVPVQLRSNKAKVTAIVTEPTTTTTTTTTSTTTTTTTAAPTTSTTTTTTTAAPTTSTTTTTTTAAPTTSTTTTTTTAAPTTSTTTTTTTAAPTTSTTTTTTTVLTCHNYNIEGAPSIDVEWLECDGTTNSDTVTTAIVVCAQTGTVTQTGGSGNITQLSSCSSPTTTTSTTTTTTTAAPTTSTTTTTTTTSAPITYGLYEAEEYDCATCTNQGTIVVAFPTAYTSSVQIGKFYIELAASGSSSYNIIQVTGSSGPGLIMATGSNYTTCAGACASIPSV